MEMAAEKGRGASDTKTVAVVLAGAVAKGAFEAGALQLLASANVRVARIVAASSGALNAVTYGAAVRNRRERAGADELVELWLDKAGFCSVFSAGFGNLRHNGLSDGAKLRKLLRDVIPVTTPVDPAPISVRLTLAPLKGATGKIDGCDATTFEAMREFDDRAYGDADLLDELFTTAIASSAFPFAFTPVDIAGAPDGLDDKRPLGLCIDGGTTNNAPINRALEDLRDELDAVVVISPTVEHQIDATDELDGFRDLLGRLVDMLINERLYRDLRKAHEVNAELQALEALCPGTITPAQLAEVKRAINWSNARVKQIVHIRPTTSLRGNPFSGFFDRELRREYIKAGQDRALAVLSGLGWFEHSKLAAATAG